MTQPLSGVRTPSSPFPLLPLRAGALFPGTVITLPVGRDRSVALLQAVTPGSIIGVVAQRSADVAEPGADDLFTIGTLARVARFERGGDRVYRLTLEGLGRFHLDAITRTDPFWLAEGHDADETSLEDPEARILARSLRTHVEELAGANEGRNTRTIGATEDQPGLVADQIAAGLALTVEREIELLSELDVTKRLRRVSELLTEAKARAELKRKIDQDVRKEFDKHQRDAVLREQLKAIRKEIGDDKGESDGDALKEKIAKADLPDEVRAAADRELRRLEASGGQGAESNVIRTYLEWIADLPWKTRATVKDDIDAVGRKLDEDHAGLADVKKRILEHMAVLKVSGNPRGTILCLAGPPGVGKTSLGQSIADATGRPFLRISLGGVRDEAEIRGHRRTYVGALPGRLITALRKAKVRNPVILLDEVDKLGNGWQGNPESALLEVLDPEQNKAFTDHYMELPFDLSEVMFICTANDLGNLSAPLRDRLEIIELAGYTIDEKVAIAKTHLVPKQIREHALADGALTVTDDALRAVVTDYTREAGVRQLTREISKVARAVTLEVARAKAGEIVKVTVGTGEEVARYLGKPKFFAEVAERVQQPGVATGMAWTPVGGDILFIETTRMPGKGRIEITGQLGDVMKESARAALSYVRSHADELGVQPDFFESTDVHIHVPAGGTPKDGPSAGVTIFTALTSLLTGRKVRTDTAMTGECTLRGRVMPVGGIKSKVLAAHRAGLSRIVLPAKNKRDAEEIPEEVRRELEFVFADDMSEVLAAALEPRAAKEDGAAQQTGPLALGVTPANNGRDASLPSAA